MEPQWWNPRGTLPQGRPGPPRSLSGTTPQSIWAETPKLSAVGEQSLVVSFIWDSRSGSFPRSLPIAPARKDEDRHGLC